MNLLMGLLVARAISGKKVKAKQVSKRVRREAMFWVQLITELSQLLNIIFNFLALGISNIYHKCRKQKQVVEEKLPENVIKFDDYKLKKAK